MGPPATKSFEGKLNLDGLGSMNSNVGQRSNNTSATNSPSGEAPAGSGIRYPLGSSGLGNGNAQAGPGRAGTGSPDKGFGGSRLFPKR